MAFSDVEIQETHAAVAQQAAPNDLYKLGLIYSTGLQIDFVQAHMWFNLAALKGYAPARECRKELASQMSPFEIAAAQKAAREWMTSASRPSFARH